MEIRLLGPTEVRTSDGQLHGVRGTKIRGLLALLALNAGRVVSVDRLIDGLYGEDPSAGAANAVQQLVSKLRRILTDLAGDGGADLVVTRPPGYLLAVDPAAVDAIHFARLLTDARSAMAASQPTRAADALAQALALWRGDPLADVDAEGAAAAERQRLIELYEVAVEERIDVDLALGHHAPLVAELELLVAATPLRERRWGQLMVARYRAGNQAGALRAFQQAREVLGEQLGIDPGPELRRLEAAVLAQDPLLDAPDVAAPAPAEAAGAPDAGPPTDPGELRAAAVIPQPLTACIGRDHELEMLERLLATKRLVTLVGPGGVGKTRLVTEYARVRADRFRQGVRFVELASIGAPAAVTPAVRAALGLSGPDPQTGTGALAVAATVAGQETLLVLDNCEHVLDAVAELVAAVLATAKDVQIVATSRQGLGIPGEQLLPVPTLPDDPAIALFVERAMAARPDLVIDDPARERVGRICARVDGLPLAIEIAASRVRLFDLDELVRRMDDRVDLTTTGPRTAAARHRTMQAVIDWSYDLLDERERAMFEVIGAFAGPVPLDAIEAVCDDRLRADAAELVADLVDKSLVVVDRSGPNARFGMLQTVQSSARARAAERGQQLDLARRHLAWLIDMVGDATTARRRSGRADVVQRIAQAMPEIQAGLAFALDDDPVIALDLAGRVSWTWMASGNPTIGYDAIERGLAAAADAPLAVLAAAHTWAAMLGPTVHHAADAVAHGEEALTIARRMGDPVTIGLACVTSVFAALTTPGDPVVVRALLDEARALLAGHDWELTMAALIESTASVFLHVFDPEKLIAEATDGSRRTGNDFGLFASLWRRAQQDLRAGSLPTAEAALREALAIAATMPDATVGIEVTSYLAVVLAVRGEREEAARLADAAVFAARRSGLRVPHRAISLAARSVVSYTGGHADSAGVDLDHAAEMFSRVGLTGLGVSTVGTFASALTAVGKPEGALRYLATAVWIASGGPNLALVRFSADELLATLRAIDEPEHVRRIEAAFADGAVPDRAAVEPLLKSLEARWFAAAR